MLLVTQLFSRNPGTDEMYTLNMMSHKGINVNVNKKATSSAPSHSNRGVDYCEVTASEPSNYGLNGKKPTKGLNVYNRQI